MPARAFSIPTPFRSVAKSWSGICRPDASANSANAMAMEYASSPVEHPSTQIRTGSWRDRPWVNRGETLPLSAPKAPGTKKAGGADQDIPVEGPPLGGGGLGEG